MSEVPLQRMRWTTTTLAGSATRVWRSRGIFSFILYYCPISFFILYYCPISFLKIYIIYCHPATLLQRNSKRRRWVQLWVCYTSLTQKPQILNCEA